jgi:ArsR family transcriptional regulator
MSSMSITDTHPISRMADKAEAAESMLKQLANAKRLMVLCSLVQSEKMAGELSELTDLSYSALSQHLSKMRGAGLVESEKRGQHVYYRIASPEAQALLSTLYLIYCHKT